MGLIQSIHDPMVAYETSVPVEIVSKLLDEIVYEYASLIADIEDDKVDATYLKKEIEKKVDSCKGLFNAEGVKKEIFDTIYGYGLLQPYVENPEVSDIDAPRYDFILIKTNGVLQEIEEKFKSEQAFDRFCRVLVIRHGGMINAIESHCRVSDKSNKLRINVSVEPRNATGASLTIRKHRNIPFSYKELERLSFLDAESHSIIQSVNNLRRNILICGKGASGKTTLLRTLIENGDKYERMLICESDTELYPQKKNVIAQHVEKTKRKSTVSTLETLLKEGLTMSLDTYCVGEITGPEAWPFIKAGYTDHRIIGTLHSKSSIDAMDRLLMLVENETRIEESSLKRLLAGSIDIVIYLKAFKVVEILELDGYDSMKNNYLVKNLYTRS